MRSKKKERKKKESIKYNRKLEYLKEDDVSDIEMENDASEEESIANIEEEMEE